MSKKGQAKEGHSQKGKERHSAEKTQEKESPSHKGNERKDLKKEMQELREALQRLQAEFENSRKRLEKEKSEFVKVAKAGLVKELLPLLDSIEAGERHLKQEKEVSKGAALEGIESIKRQLLAVLKAEGLEEIGALGGKFDPMLHECVMQGKEEGKKDEEILEEMQKGYLFNGNVIRHSKVKVNKA